MISAQGWWIASRSAGIVAFLLLSSSVVIGLTMALKLAPPRLRPALVVTHERVALLALAAIGAHGLMLLPDPWLKPKLTDVILPFTASYRPLWTGLGVCAAYLASGLALSYYARRKVGTRRWRKAHRFIPIAWAMAAVHAFGAGTDAGSLWLQVTLIATIVAVAGLLAWRVLGGKRDPAPAKRPLRSPEPA